MKHKARILFTLIAVCAAARADPVRDLPLIVDAPVQPGQSLAIFLSGDGGWAKIDSQFSAELLRAGYGVVGLNSYRYFKDEKTPEQLAHDLARIDKAYSQSWQRSRLLLIGYSRGAEVLPFAINRLDAAVKSRIEAVVLLGPATFTGFKLHLADLIENRRRPDSVDVLPEASKVGGRIVCVYGREEQDSLCPALAATATLLPMGGAHHFGGDYPALAKQVLSLLDGSAARAGTDR